MYGWRARIGALIVAPDTTPELEFMKMAPEGVSVHFTRMFFPGAVTVENLEKLAEEAEKAAALLHQLNVDVVAFCCTSGSFIKGVGYDEEIIKRIKKKVPDTVVTTTTTSVIDALNKLGVKKIAIATPYTDEINKIARDFFEKLDFEVVDIKGLQIVDDLEIGTQPPGVAYSLAKSVDKKEAECIFISCTNIGTIEIIEHLECDLDKPVISSNQATMWDALRKARVLEPVKGFGRLLRCL